jgi:sialate O-acetylesterase
MLTLHPLFGDDAVLQCEKPLRIWGTAAAGAEIGVCLAGRTRKTTATCDGSWSVVLPPLPPGGPVALEVCAAGEHLKRNNILLGEVWLCSGQSNMEYALGMLRETETAIAAANDAQLRCFTVARIPTEVPVESVTGRWRPATAQHVRDFSAVAYFFAARLRAELDRPVGVIVAAFGGTMIVSWMPRTALAGRPDYRVFLDPPEAKQSEEMSFAPHVFEGRGSVAAGWESATYEDADWDTLPVPGFWQTSGWQHNGSVWYRRQIELPHVWRGHELVLEIGACDDFDDTFVNGVWVGGVGPDVANAYAMRRAYRLAADLTEARVLSIAVRVFDHWGNGGIVGGVSLRRADGADAPLSLDGLWRAKTERALPLRASAGGMPGTVLYNGMIHSLGGSAIRGVLWYQGESDIARAALYRMLLPDLIEAWRARWQEPLLPFGVVQLASYQPTSPVPVESEWAELRDAQALAARTLPAVGLAVTIDLGEPDDIHPARKQPVADRLADWALARVYGFPNTQAESPMVVDHWGEAGAMFLRFTGVGRGLRSRGGLALAGFQIAGGDRCWTWADAEVVQRDIVRVSAAHIEQPVAVRYAWQGSPQCSLENSGGFPAAPFRTDDWPLLTRR